MNLNFYSFFTTAYGADRPSCACQRRRTEARCKSRLITAPTGLGKTAAVIFPAISASVQP